MSRGLFSFSGNGGTAYGVSHVVNVSIGASEVSQLRDFAVSNQVQLVVVGPELPLVEGIHAAFKSGKLQPHCFVLPRFQGNS